MCTYCMATEDFAMSNKIRAIFSENNCEEAS